MPEKPRNTQKILEEARTVLNETGRAHEDGSYEESETRIFQPFFAIKTETQAAASGKNQMRFTETEKDEFSREQLAHHITRLEEREGVKGDFSNQENWRAVDELEYTMGKTKLDIFSFLPKGYKVLICPTSELHTGSVDIEKKIIYIPNDMSSLGGLATILHEVGHVKDQEHLEQMERTEFIEGGDEYENRGAEILRKEREASLFALRKMWKELRKDQQTKEDVLLFLKNIAYHSYCDSSLGIAATNRIMAHHSPYDIEADEAEMLEREQFDAWWKFKHSNKYQDWKNLKENAQLHEDEEYGAWRKWIEDTDKVNDPEFMLKYFGYEE